MNKLLFSILISPLLLSGCREKNIEYAEIRLVVTDCDSNPVMGAEVMANNSYYVTSSPNGSIILKVEREGFNSVFPASGSPYTFDEIKVEGLQPGESRSLGYIVSNECAGHLTVNALHCENNPWSGMLYFHYNNTEFSFPFTGSTHFLVPPGFGFSLQFYPFHMGSFYWDDSLAIKRYTLDNYWPGRSPYYKEGILQSGESGTITFDLCNASVINGITGNDSVSFAYPEWKYIFSDTHNGFWASKSRSIDFTGKPELEWRFNFKPTVQGQVYTFPDSSFEARINNIRYLSLPNQLNITYSKIDSGYIHGHLWGTLFESQNISNTIPIDLTYKISTLKD